MRTRSIIQTICLTTLAAATAALPACHSPKGGIMPSSTGSYTYYSTETQPKSVRIVDMRSDETVFAINIPADKQLTFDFIPGKGDDPVETPDLMKWEVLPLGTMTGTLRNSMTVPNAASRKIIVELRDDFEYAEAPHERPKRINGNDDGEGENAVWWSPQGGPIPEDQQNAGTTMYDN